MSRLYLSGIRSNSHARMAFFHTQKGAQPIAPAHLPISSAMDWVSVLPHAQVTLLNATIFPYDLQKWSHSMRNHSMGEG